MCHKPGDIPYPETSSSAVARYYVKKDKFHQTWDLRITQIRVAA